MLSQYEYDYSRDTIYCYPDSSVLINKFGIRDRKLLSEIEGDYSFARYSMAMHDYIPGKMDFRHLKDIHRFVFGDIYEWAGEIRKVDIAKGIPFCKYAYIESQGNNLFSQLKREHFLIDLFDKSAICKRLAYFFAEINALHPFREGNGRAQRILIGYLGLVNGYSINYSVIGTKEMIVASSQSMTGENDLLESILDRAMITISKKEIIECRELLLP
ncbi:MAG: Fic/DOC family protein [Flexilinea sp.]